MRADRSSFRFLMAVAVGLTCTAAISIGLTIWWLRSEAIREANINANNIVTVLAEQTSRSIQSIDLMLDGLQERIDVLGAKTPNDFHRLLRGEDIHQLLTERMARLSHVATISLVDRNGTIINSTNQWPMPPIDISDRQHFQHAKNNNNQDIHVSDPVVDRSKNMPTVYFYKRINNTNNELLGIISIGIRLSHFQQIYESIGSLDDLSMLFLRKDGTIILRYPYRDNRAGAKMPAGSPWYGLVSKG